MSSVGCDIILKREVVFLFFYCTLLLVRHAHGSVIVRMSNETKVLNKLVLCCRRHLILLQLMVLKQYDSNENYPHTDNLK